MERRSSRLLMQNPRRRNKRRASIVWREIAGHCALLSPFARCGASLDKVLQKYDGPTMQSVPWAMLSKHFRHELRPDLAASTLISPGTSLRSLLALTAFLSSAFAAEDGLRFEAIKVSIWD